MELSDALLYYLVSQLEAEEIPNLEAERQYIEDCIDDDGPKIFELKGQKESLVKELRSMLEEVDSAGEYGKKQL